MFMSLLLRLQWGEASCGYRPAPEEDSLCLSGPEQPVLHGKQCRATAGLDAKLGVDRLDVVVDRLRRQAEFAPDLLRRQTPRGMHQHVDLARRETGNERHLLAPATQP